MKPGWSLPQMQSPGRRGLYAVYHCTFYSCLWFQCCFMSTETIRLIRNWGSPGQPPRLSHSSWALNASSVERVLHIPTRWWTRTLWQHTRSFSFFVCPLPPCHLCGCRPQYWWYVSSLCGAAQKVLVQSLQPPKERFQVEKARIIRGDHWRIVFWLLENVAKVLYN